MILNSKFHVMSTLVCVLVTLPALVLHNLSEESTQARDSREVSQQSPRDFVEWCKLVNNPSAYYRKTVRVKVVHKSNLFYAAIYDLDPACTITSKKNLRATFYSTNKEETKQLREKIDKNSSHKTYGDTYLEMTGMIICLPAGGKSTVDQCENPAFAIISIEKAEPANTSSSSSKRRE